MWTERNPRLRLCKTSWFRCRVTSDDLIDFLCVSVVPEFQREDPTGPLLPGGPFRSSSWILVSVFPDPRSRSPKHDDDKTVGQRLERRYPQCLWPGQTCYASTGRPQDGGGFMNRA